MKGLTAMLCTCVVGAPAIAEDANLLVQLDSPIVIQGNNTTAFRDPAACYHNGTFYLFFTEVETEKDGSLFWYTSVSKSGNLKNWSPPRKITPRDQDLNFSSPGNIIRFKDQWVLCLQTYPIPGLKRSEPLRWGGSNARIFIMRSKDLENWGEPELLRVKGPDVARENMGRMIDPYLVEDVGEPGKWWCFYKQRGVSYSWSRDLATWTFAGRASSGENVCVLVDQDEYLLFHSPGNGIGMKRSRDLEAWRSCGDLITLGQAGWPWAELRLTAGFVLDLRDTPSVGKYVMFFHGSGPGKMKTPDNTHANCNLGIAWSGDLGTWDWPGRSE